MNFLEDYCSFVAVKTPTDIQGFCCGDDDLDDFFAHDCFAFSNNLLGKTYCYRLDQAPHTPVCAFTLANASIRVSDLPNARKKKIEANIPYLKSLRDYPAVLIARLGVDKHFSSKGIGSNALNFIKIWFLEPENKTGCRFIIVDAYNNSATLSFYTRNGFAPVFSSEAQEKEYRNLNSETSLSTRLLYFDLIKFTSK